MGDEIRRLGPWLQNVHLPDGTQTAPKHPLGDWPRKLWRGFEAEMPDLDGRRVLDIGCNAGFYCIEAARRGAEVVGIEPNPRYRRQADFTARAWGLQDRIDVRDGQVYDLAHAPEPFDVVFFLGVFYHLRYPLLALDSVARVCRGRLFFQSLMTPGKAQGPDDRRPPGAGPPPGQGPSEGAFGQELAALDAPDWPKLAFVEHQLFNDPTNRWVPNPQGVEAMLRSAGFTLAALRGGVYVCQAGGKRHAWSDAEFHAAVGQPWQTPEHLFEPVEGTLESRTA